MREEVSIPFGFLLILFRNSFLHSIGYVIPGFVDVHAHWNGFDNRYPAKSFELETFLAYGVTTLHNPSADTVDAFVERSRVEAGFTVGPRIFSVGTIIYGAGEAGYYQDVTDMDEAKSALVRIKAEGGGYAISYKNYNIPSRWGFLEFV
jgi:imidazolonepropionase-like amidohydrolase